MPLPAVSLFSNRNTEGYLQKIQVSDLTGRTLIQKEVKENQINLDISTLSNGLYILKIETREGKEGIKKFVKE